MRIRQASFALRVVRRRAGQAGVLYRRSLNSKQQERLTKIAPLSPLALLAGTSLLRAAMRADGVPSGRLIEGPFHPLDDNWGARVGCYALVAAGLRDPERLHKAAMHLQHADGAEAAWWLGLMSGSQKRRSVRAMRILVEAVR